jgi:hypothetical protein
MKVLYVQISHKYSDCIVLINHEFWDCILVINHEYWYCALVCTLLVTNIWTLL